MSKQDKQKKVSVKIQKVLEDAGLALQPFLSFSEHGIVPRVRLVDPKQNANEQETDTEEAGRDEESNKPADSDKS